MGIIPRECQALADRGSNAKREANIGGIIRDRVARLANLATFVSDRAPAAISLHDRAITAAKRLNQKHATRVVMLECRLSNRARRQFAANDPHREFTRDLHTRVPTVRRDNYRCRARTRAARYLESIESIESIFLLAEKLCAARGRDLDRSRVYLSLICLFAHPPTYCRRLFHYASRSSSLVRLPLAGNDVDLRDVD